MKVINYWEHFLTTGSVSDYLNYLGDRRQNGQRALAGSGSLSGAADAEASEWKCAGGVQSDGGAGKVEGTGQRYRNDIESGTHRGI